MKEPVGPYTSEERITLAGLQNAMRRFRGKVIPIVQPKLKSLWPDGVGVVPTDERGGFVIDLRDRCDA